MRLTAKHRAHLTVIRIAAACAGALVTTTLVAQSVFPTGTTRYDPKKAFNSFVLFTSDTVARLIDMNGNLVREWKNAADLTTLIDPSLVGGQRGHVLVTLTMANEAGTDLTPARLWAAQTIVSSIGTARPSGRLERKLLTSSRVSIMTGPGCRTATHSCCRRDAGIAGFKLPVLRDDVIYEVNRAGEIVWTWIAGDHLLELGSRRSSSSWFAKPRIPITCT
jgi:hypothetical protein